MAKQKLTVTFDGQTITRTTARTYTHIVLVSVRKFEALEARRIENLKAAQQTLADYRETVATGISPTWRALGRGGEWDRECTAKFLADGSYIEFIAEQERRVEAFETPYTQDAPFTVWNCIGWCGRIDLARKLANTVAADYRDVRIIEVATGKEVL